MSRALAFRVRLLRACSLGAHVHLAGAVVELEALTAGELVREGRGRLEDGSDLAVLADALAASGGRWTTPHTR